MYRATIAEFDVDRVLFLDADEFWLPKSGNIKSTASLACSDALSVRRFNVPLVEGRPLLPRDLSPNSYSDLYLIADPVKNAARMFQTNPSLSWIMTEVGPKTIINPRTVEGVGMGTHGIVEKEGMKSTVVVPDDLVIAHVPFSTYDRFSRKIANIERSLSVFGHQLIGSQAWHWRRWLQLAKEGKAEQEFQRQVLMERDFCAAQSEGKIQSVRALFDAAASSRFNQRP